MTDTNALRTTLTLHICHISYLNVPCGVGSVLGPFVFVPWNYITLYTKHMPLISHYQQTVMC